MIACILCGSIIETTLFALGLSAIIAWFKKRHNTKKCKCCQKQNEFDSNESDKSDESCSCHKH